MQRTVVQDGIISFVTSDPTEMVDFTIAGQANVFGQLNVGNDSMAPGLITTPASDALVIQPGAAGNLSFVTTSGGAIVINNVQWPTNSPTIGTYIGVSATNTLSFLSPPGGGGGTVTSVGVSGGSTGLTTTGGPITVSGTITLTGTLAIANGGTGQTSAPAAINALAPTQTGNSGKFLTTDGTSVSWGSAGGGSGTVTSVDVIANNGMTISGNPITTSGTLTFGLGNITPLSVLATGTLTVSTSVTAPSMGNRVTTGFPTIDWNVSTGGTNSKLWSAWSDATTMHFSAIRDDQVITHDWLQVTRTSPVLGIDSVYFPLELVVVNQLNVSGTFLQDGGTASRSDAPSGIDMASGLNAGLFTSPGGGQGIGATATATVSGGVVTAFSIVSGGTGYTTTDYIWISSTILGVAGSGMSLPVLTVGGSGNILTFGALVPGSGYTDGTYTGVAVSVGSGNSTSTINSYSSSTVFEIGSGASGGPGCGIVMNGSSAIVNPSTINTYIGGQIVTTIDSSGNFIIGTGTSFGNLQVPNGIVSIGGISNANVILNGLSDGTLNLNGSVITSGPARAASPAPGSAIGTAGDLAGDIRFDASFVYICQADFDGSTNIWTKSALVPF